MIGCMVGLCLLLSNLVGSPAAVAGTIGDTSFDYLYIESNEGGSSGGHTAIRFGRDVYHFQNENGLLVLQRDRASDFLYTYALLGNRTIHSTRVAISSQTLATLVARFKQRHRAQEAQIDVATQLRIDRDLLQDLRDRDDSLSKELSSQSLAIPGLGYFATRISLEPEAEPSETEASRPEVQQALQSLREAIDRVHGTDYRSKRRLLLLDTIRALLAENPVDWAVRVPISAYQHPPFARSVSHRLLDLASGLAALDVLDQARPLAEAARQAPTDETFALSDEEIRALATYRKELAERLIQLVDSRRTDWGQTLLVGMARLSALSQSIESRHLVFLDSFPDDTKRLNKVERHRLEEFGSKVLTEAREKLDAARGYFRGNPKAGELAWERVEERSNRYFEIRRAMQDGAPMRSKRGHLIPARKASYATPFPISRSLEARADDLARARRRERDYGRALRRLHRYGLFAHNCATALFETINDSFEDSENDSRILLGGHIHSRNSLAFIPFVSAHQVNSRYSVLARQTIPSYRQLRIQAMKDVESPLRVALRESNTFTSTTYERSSADSFFIFFTDDAPYIRPILGIVNLTAALGQSLLGLFAAPIDRGDILMRGLRGTFVSLPELAFANIRKGSNDWIPTEYRILDAIPDEP